MTEKKPCECSFRCEKCQEPLRYPLIYGLHPDVQKLIVEKATAPPALRFEVYEDGHGIKTAIYKGDTAKYIHWIDTEAFTEYIDGLNMEYEDKKITAYLRGEEENLDWQHGYYNDRGDKRMLVLYCAKRREKHIHLFPDDDTRVTFSREKYETVLDDMLRALWDYVHDRIEKPYTEEGED